jgi:hypothetical protein
MLIKLRKLIKPLKIRIITRIKGNLPLISSFSLFFNLLFDTFLDFIIVYEDYRILSLEIPFEIAVFTVKDTV